MSTPLRRWSDDSGSDQFLRHDSYWAVSYGLCFDERFSREVV